MKKLAVIVICIFIGLSSFCKNNQKENVTQNNGRSARVFYLSSVHGSADGDGSLEQPWSLLSSIDQYDFAPGDTICFECGSNWTGNFSITASGTQNAAIVFTSYGTGEKPVISNPDYNRLHGNAIQVHGAHIVIDGLSFKSCANSNSKVSQETLHVGAVYAVTGADYLLVRNCEFTDCPIGIYINSQHCLITRNYLHDCNRFLSEPDWGPIGIVVGNAFNEISYNYCTNYVKVGGNYGADGGFIEFDDRFFGTKVHDVSVHHNRSFANQGFLEIEGKVTGDNLDVSYNLSDDYQQFIFYWGGNNSKIENNTIIRTRPSNNGAVNTVFTMQNDKFLVKNNIFVVANGIQVFVTAPYDIGNYDNAVHTNNIYYCTDSSTTDPCGKPLGDGEKIGNPQFIDLNNSDYHLQSTSPAIDGGIDLGYDQDLDGTKVPQGSLPDMGAFEYKPQ